MLSKLDIAHLKGINSFAVENLSRVNLIIGKNDSGKSTILEAITYMFRELHGGMPSLQELISRRTDSFSGLSELWYGYRTKDKIEIQVTLNSILIVWQISLKPVAGSPYDLVSSFKQIYGSPIVERPLGEAQYSREFSFSARSIGLDSIKTDEKTRAQILAYSSSVSLIDCTLKSKTNVIEGILGRLKIEGKDAKFGAILNDIYGKGKKWEFLPHPEKPELKRLAFREGGSLKYFADFGDGLKFCVGILGTAMTMENSCLCIEEIESHQHSGSLKKLVHNLVDISRENNLQLFLSTHSKDVWESLHRGVYLDDEALENSEFRCILIERDSNTGKVTSEKTDDVQKIDRALE